MSQFVTTIITIFILMGIITMYNYIDDNTENDKPDEPIKKMTNVSVSVAEATKLLTSSISTPPPDLLETYAPKKAACYKAVNRNECVKLEMNSNSGCDQYYASDSESSCKQFIDSTNFNIIDGEYKAEDGTIVSIEHFNQISLTGNLRYRDAIYPFKLYDLVYTGIGNQTRPLFSGYITNMLNQNRSNKLDFYHDGQLTVYFLQKNFFKI